LERLEVQRQKLIEEGVPPDDPRFEVLDKQIVDVQKHADYCSEKMHTACKGRIEQLTKEKEELEAAVARGEISEDDPRLTAITARLEAEE